MRVTEGMLSSSLLRNYNKVLEKQTKTELEVATNNRIQTLSDDVDGSIQSINLNSQINKIDTYLKNCDTATSFITSSLNALDNVTTQMQTIITTITSSENAINQDNYETLAQTLKDSLSSIVDSINSKQNGMYLFGGTNYKEEPASIVNGKAVTTTEDLSGQVKSQISQNVSIAINVTGSKIFDTGMFDAINDLIDSLSSGNAPTDAEKTALDDAYSKIVDIQTLTGQSQNRIDDIKTVLNNQSTNYKELFTSIQEIDEAQLSTDLKTQDYLLQLISQLLASSLSKSVFDYL